MTVNSFAEVTRQVHLIHDLILSDMIYVDEDSAEDAAFKKHLLATKYWFARVSWANKRRYALALLKDIRSAWALSLLLKALWNCRPKDAVYSSAEPKPLCGFDQVPMDHNRTAKPVKVLAQVMTSDRKWFHTLDPESQAMVLADLVVEGGGPLLWEMTRRARTIYERYREHQLRSLPTPAAEPVKSDKSSPQSKSPPPNANQPQPGKDAGATAVLHITHRASGDRDHDHAQKHLEASLAAWNDAIKAIRNSQKLEEVEMTFDDGTSRKLWKVNRQVPEGIETVDFVQLLPSSIGKRILTFLPLEELSMYAKVNKYWAYLVDELRAEWSAREKIDEDLAMLKEEMLKHDTSFEMLVPGQHVAPSSLGASLAPSQRAHVQVAPSVRPSEKSGASYKFTTEKLKPAKRTKQKAFRNLSELNDRLERRGAADDNLWTWCRNVLKQDHKGCTAGQPKKKHEGVMHFGAAHFPCPLMKQAIEMPLSSPLLNDPSKATSAPPRVRRNISNSTMLTMQAEPTRKRFSLWSPDFSSLYKVLKVASYQSPV